MAKALTAASVEKLKPDPERRLEIPDALVPGLYLVIQPSGKKSWAARFRVNGKPKKLTLGGFPALELDQARDAARTAFLAAQRGSDPAAEKQAKKRAAREHAADDRDAYITIARQFIERHAKPNNRSWLKSANALGLRPDPGKPADRENPSTFIAMTGGAAERWHGKRVQEITRRDVIELLDVIVDRGAGVMANRTLAALKTLFAWSIGRDVLAASPAAGLKAPTAETHRDRALSDGELKAVWHAAESIGWPFGSAVQALILTGQRREEVGAMSWREIDAARTTWTIPRARAKNDSEHAVPISPALAALLDRLPRVAGEAKLIFTTNGSTSISGWSKAKAAIDEKALELLKKWAVERDEDPAEITFADWRLHDIRRTVATGLAKLRVDLPVIEKILNHVSGSFGGIVSVYQKHSFADEKRAALDAWGNFVTGLVTGGPASNVTPLRKAAS
ncbi:MAG TPA: integrase arm-type DNA-binding domain-containing protein [Kaistia sp.]|nr:integrase arm-type DNA-binding domain-containing protein [Kaistia sp.]